MRKRSNIAVVVVFVTMLSGLPVDGMADEKVTSESRSGQWIRVTTSSDLPGIARLGARIEGALQRLDEDRLVLERGPNAETVTVPRSAIARLDVRQRASSRGKWARIGGLVGLAAGVSIGLASGSDKDCSFIPSLCFSAGEKATLYSVFTLPAGALIGLALGRGSEWKEDVPVDNLRLSVGPARGRGIAITVTRVF